MKNTILFLFLALGLFACKDKNTEAIAYGNFEAVETLVSAETGGKILWFPNKEGDVLSLDQHTVSVDTTMLTLQMKELLAQKLNIKSKIASVRAQSEIVIQQQANLKIEQQRIANLHKNGAATQKQLDDINGMVAVNKKQINANTEQVASVKKELVVLEAKKDVLANQISNCYIKNPVQGTILEKFAEAGEITAPGKPLYKIADLERIILKAYVSGAMLQTVKIGENCKVFIDKGADELANYEGTITWVASQSEFTPKIIQTQEERVNLVYAVKIEVENDGRIKIGMPGEVIF